VLLSFRGGLCPQAIGRADHRFGAARSGRSATAAAFANAVVHAIGRRIRDLPLAPELVMD
jgi:CO/xanthine dehydrogenase Mo-binding subunit